MTGVGLALSIGPGSGVIVGVGVGLAVFAGMGLFLQKNVCGMALDNWGPFEGLKGVPGWDSDLPHDDPMDRPAPAQAQSDEVAATEGTEAAEPTTPNDERRQPA